MNDQKIEIVTIVGGFWLQIGTDVYLCKLTPYKIIPEQMLTLSEFQEAEAGDRD